MIVYALNQTLPTQPLLGGGLEIALFTFETCSLDQESLVIHIPFTELPKSKTIKAIIIIIGKWVPMNYT